MAILHVENNFSYLQGTDQDILGNLHKALRFRDRGYFHNPRYRAGLWDGFHEFFKPKTGRFLTGLLPEIRGALAHYGVAFEVKDGRKTFPWNVDSVDEDYLHEETGHTLRDYQVDYANIAIRNSRGLVYAPTSSGKTSVMQAIAKAAREDAPILVLCNKKDLVEQNYDALVQAGVKDVGKIYTGVFKPNRITCSTWQSCSKIVDWLPTVKGLLVDEIHDNMSAGPKGVYRQLSQAAMRIAFSATPFKYGGKDKVQKYDVKGWIGPEFLIGSVEGGKLTTKRLQERKIISSCECTFLTIDKPTLSPYLIYPDAVTQGIAENKHFHDIVTRLCGRLKGRTLIIVERIAHGDALLDRMPHALWVRGQDNMKTRKSVIQRLKTDASNVVAIATAGIFNTGINVFLHQLVNAAGGQAEHVIIQRLGRGLRVAEDKLHLEYIDFMFRSCVSEYLEKHSESRISTLEREGHKVTVKEVDF